MTAVVMLLGVIGQRRISQGLFVEAASEELARLT